MRTPQLLVLALTLISTGATSGVAVGQCLTTGFQTTTGVLGPTRWAYFFDLTATRPVVVSSLEVHCNSPGAPVGVEVWISAGTYRGHENDPAAWMRVAEDDGLTVAQAGGTPTPVNLAAPWDVAAGTVGVAIVQTGAPSLFLFGGTAGNTFADPVLSIAAGSFAAPPLQPGALVIDDRIFSGSLCYTALPGLGTYYCGPPAPNSTGHPARIAGHGSLELARDELWILVDRVPPNAFGFLLSSRTQGLVVHPGGSQGTLCLGGAVGRHLAAIQNSGPFGKLEFHPALHALPTPTGPRAAQVGETWNFQVWYRDANPTWTSNFTEGVAVTLE